MAAGLEDADLLRNEWPQRSFRAAEDKVHFYATHHPIVNQVDAHAFDAAPRECWENYRKPPDSCEIRGGGGGVTLVGIVQSAALVGYWKRLTRGTETTSQRDTTPAPWELWSET